MSAKIIAVYSLKGGVGKTTLAVNLAWASATISARRTLLWDLDAQAAATYILGHRGKTGSAAKVVHGTGKLDKLVRETDVTRLDLLPADASLRDLDLIFHDLDKKKRLAKVADELGRDHDRIVIDCPPGLTDTSDQILRAADIVVVPVIPSSLSHRALETIAVHVSENKGMKAPLFPVFSMVDRRRKLHREAIAEEKRWPVIPMASAFEAMGERRAPLGPFASRGTVGVQAVAEAWRRIEKELVSAK